MRIYVVLLLCIYVARDSDGRARALSLCIVLDKCRVSQNARGVMVSDDVRCLMRLSSFSANWLAAFDVVDGAQVLPLLALLAQKYNH